jgi:hypothetical protein
MEILIFLILMCFIFLILNYFLRVPIEIYILIVAIGFVFSQLVLQTKDINTKSLSEKGYNSYLSNASAIGTKRSLDNNSQKQKQSYNMDTFRIKPLPGRDNKINHGGKVVIAVASRKQGNTRYNGCGWYGCRVLKQKTGYFSHGGKNKDMPGSVMTIKNYNLALYSNKKNAPIKFGETIALDTIDGVTKQQLPLLKILRPPPHNNNRTGIVGPNHTVMFVDANYEEKIYVMLNNRFGTMIDIVPGMKPDNLNNNRNNELSII